MKRKAGLDIEKFAREIVLDCPKQENGGDCGVFVCQVAEFLSRNVKPRFSQKDMPFFRDYNEEIADIQVLKKTQNIKTS